MQHLAIYLDALASYSEAIKDHARRAADDADVREEKAHVAEQLTWQRVQAAVEAIFNQMLASVQERNALLDTEDNYLREQSECHGW